MEMIAIFGCFIMVVLPILFVVSLIFAITRNSKRWSAVTVVVGVLSLIAVIVLVAYAGRQGAAVMEKLDQPRSFVSSDGRVEVTAPGTWREQDFENEVASLQLGNLMSEQYLLIISEEKRVFVPEFGIREYAETISEQMLEVLENPVESELVSGETGGYPSFQREFEGEIEGMGIAYLNTFVEGEEAFHQILTWTLRERREKNFPIFRKVIDSFRELVPREDQGADNCCTVCRKNCLVAGVFCGG